ncbi:uncharacterized protein Z518_07579 [Rhinocladiella mackenziei CBS 650.93]|uniref:Uncharacterized protein n=1 Tax=Rhinocladiella mackenziei CBS 650.93 TaxID=1442369 RepID=A0A0D2ILG8_9EURO|nr:uncharacterized protein Z518_07579 [Rhinocladiella mackenziei CBS 650.93]KIX04026.1 hypothetical protein Z518_07579 [Rhinocladiella mackenziei CBS 650.93]
MTQALWPSQPSLMVIEENGLSSRYNQRMTEQESEDSKPILLRLNEEGASREARTEEAVVDTLRRNLRLINRQNQPLAQPQGGALPTGTSDAFFSVQNRSQSEVTATTSSGNRHPELVAASAPQNYNLIGGDDILSVQGTANWPRVALDQFESN